jgi:hypothetical protein
LCSWNHQEVDYSHLWSLSSAAAQTPPWRQPNQAEW